MTLIGVIEDIVFANNETGYTVVDLSSKGALITAVGIFPPIVVGEQVELTGEFTDNSKYGEQFNVSKVTSALPATIEGIERYLSSGLFRGIGPITARAIVSMFKEETLAILKNNPLELAKVRGISKAKAKEIGTQFGEMQDMQDTILYLQEYDISLGLCLKIYKCYEDRTKAVLLENPYQLVEDIDGVGFATADKIAKNMGIAPDSLFRIRAGISYILKDSSMRAGHTYLPKVELIDNLYALLGIRDIDVESVLLDLQLTGDIVKEYRYGDEIVALGKHYHIEKNIASKLIALNNGYNPINIDLDRDISDYERCNGITLHPKQKEAVRQAVNSGVFVLTGGPGTGKTTIIKCILYILNNQNLKFRLCAPTGRAAKRMSEATGEEARTLHRLLKIEGSNDDYFTYDERNPLDADVVIVDEVSMADIFIFSALVKAIKTGSRLIIVGDKDQLPSVGAGNVLKDIITSGIVPVVCLEYIYRQNDASSIVSNAHLINAGEMPVLSGCQDFFYIKAKEQSEVLDVVKDLVTSRLPKYLGVAPQEIQVLTAMKKGTSGVNNINKTLQSSLNTNIDGITYGETIYKVGDKVMQTANDYKMDWKCIDEEGNETYGQGVFNGDIGEVDSVDKDTSTVVVRFEDGRYCEYHNELSDITLAYAMSIHKSQGCEFDAVVIALTGGSPQILTRNLLYTAVTRAKKLVVVVGTDYLIKRMVTNDYTAKRYSLLKDFLLEENEKYEELYSGH